MYDVRINARLDENSEEKLAYLEKETGLSVSEIMRRAIASYYSRFRNDNADPSMALIKAGFVGCGEASEDLSTSYKQHLKDLHTKHGDR